MYIHAKKTFLLTFEQVLLIASSEGYVNLHTQDHAFEVKTVKIDGLQNPLFYHVYTSI